MPLPVEDEKIKQLTKQFVDSVQMFYEDTGWTTFKLFAYVISKEVLQ